MAQAIVSLSINKIDYLSASYEVRYRRIPFRCLAVDGAMGERGDHQGRRLAERLCAVPRYPMCSHSNQLLNTLRFFDLIDLAGHPKPALRDLVDASGGEQWAALLARHIREAYAPLLALKLESVSPAQFQETFRKSYSGEGDTSRKSVSFFLSAATEAKIPISSYLLKNKKPLMGLLRESQRWWQLKSRPIWVHSTQTVAINMISRTIILTADRPKLWQASC